MVRQLGRGNEHFSYERPGRREIRRHSGENPVQRR